MSNPTASPAEAKEGPVLVDQEDDLRGGVRQQPSKDREERLVLRLPEDEIPMAHGRKRYHMPPKRKSEPPPGCAASEGGAPFVARRAVNLHGCALPHCAPPLRRLRQILPLRYRTNRDTEAPTAAGSCAKAPSGGPSAGRPRPGTGRLRKLAVGLPTHIQASSSHVLQPLVDGDLFPPSPPGRS